MPNGSSLSFTAIVTILALLLYLYMGLNVSAMRDRYGVKPPATVGAPEFERTFRIHQNTLEAMPVFLASLWLAAIFFHPLPWLPAAVALVWIAGRFLFMQGYMAAPEKRGLGLRIQALAMLVNLTLALTGIAMTKMA